MELTGNYIKTAKSTINDVELTHNLSFDAQDKFTGLFSEIRKGKNTYVGNATYKTDEKRISITIIGTDIVPADVRAQIYVEIETVIAQMMQQ